MATVTDFLPLRLIRRAIGNWQAQRAKEMAGLFERCQMMALWSVWQSNFQA